MKTAVIYTRVSTEEQAKHDLSLPFQRDKCRELADKEQYSVLEFFEDAGKSARTANRPDLLRMLSYISEHKINAVIVHKSDRLSRDMADFWTIHKMFKDKKIKLLSVTENFDDSNPSSQFLMGVMSAQAQYYSANLGHEVKKGHAQKIKNGWWPTFAPFGYENYGTEQYRKIRPIPKMVKHIKQAFNLYSTGEHTIDTLTKEMQKLGMVTHTGHHVTRSVISRILRNPIYYGVIPWNGKIYEGKHKPIITKEVFDSVQSIANLRKLKGTRDRKHNFTLRGFVYCTCGAMLTGEIKTKRYRNGNTQKFLYFGCRNTKKDKKCSRIYIQMPEMEFKVAQLLKDLSFTEEFRKYVIDTAKSIIDEMRENETEEEKLLKQTIHKVKIRMKNAEDDRFDRVISAERFADAYERLNKELEAAEIDLSRIQKDHTGTVKILDGILKLSENIYKTYTEATPELKRQYLSLFIKKVIVDNKEIKKVIYTKQIKALMKIEQVRIREDWRRGRDSNPG